MANIHRIKRQILHDAVVENVDLIRGKRRARSAAGRPHWKRFAAGFGTAAVVIVSPALVLLSNPPLRADLLRWATGIGAPQSAATDPSDGDGTARLIAPIPRDASNAEASLRAEAPATVAEVAADLSFDGAPTKIDRSVFPLPVRTIVIDPGHGGPNHGTEHAGLREKDLTLEIGQRVAELLESSGFEVLMTRRDDTSISLDERVAFANFYDGDLFVSIHVNWLGRAGGGIETYYLGRSDDPRGRDLAAIENRDSGYTLSDFRNLLDGLYGDLRREDSRDLARSIQTALHGSLSEVTPDLRNRGVKTAPFVVLIGTQMPAILAEVSSLSDEQEVALLRDPAYRQRIAEALHRGVLGYAETLDIQPGTSPSTASAAAADRAP